MSNPLRDKHIILGITGSIAAYKGADLASKLTQSGALVDVLLTAAALKFVTPLTFQSVTGRKAFTDAELWGGEAHVIHVGIGHSADLLVVAPASANTIAKLANGIGDNLLCVTALATQCPLVLAPAMDGDMYAHPATQANVEVLRQRGAVIVGPAAGHLASGLVGVGRMTEPLEILGHIRFLLGKTGRLQGKKVVISAGGTQEAIDPVRMITNRSSGRQGYALAQSALDEGAEVVLVTTPTHLPAPVGARLVPVLTAQEMLSAVLAESADADVLIMAAAVADFRPVQAATQKLKKQAGIPFLELEPTQDILAAVAAQRITSNHPLCVVGFAAESQNLLQNAQTKLQTKGLDLIAANDISATDAGFEVSTNRVTLLFADGRVDALPMLSKDEVAERILDEVIACL